MPIVSTGEITIIDLFDGVNAALSQEAFVVPTLNDGTAGDFTGCSTTMRVYLGRVDDSANWTVTAAASTGVVGSLTTRTYTVTAMNNVDVGTVDLTASKTGYDSFTLRFTVTKARRGTNGANGTNGTNGTNGAPGTNGTDGAPGERGSKQFFIVSTGTGWSDALADQAITDAGLTKVLNDVVTQTNLTTKWTASKFWTGSAWISVTVYIDGNLLVDGTIGAEKLVANSITANYINGADLSISASGVELGKDVGPGVGHYGLSLSDTNFNNIFLKRDDGVTFFRVNEGGANSLTFDSETGVLAIKGVLSASQIAVGNVTGATTFYDPGQPAIPINSSVNGFLAYTGDTGVGTTVTQTCYSTNIKTGATYEYDCSYTVYAGAPITSSELEFITGTTNAPVTRRVRTGSVRFVVIAAGTVEHFFSIWYRYKNANGTYGAWVCMATATEPQSGYGGTSVSSAYTATLSAGMGIQFGFSATNAAGNYSATNQREIRFGTITVTGTNF